MVVCCLRLQLQRAGLQLTLRNENAYGGVLPVLGSASVQRTALSHLTGSQAVSAVADGCVVT